MSRHKAYGDHSQDPGFSTPKSNRDRGGAAAVTDSAVPHRSEADFDDLAINPGRFRHGDRTVGVDDRRPGAAAGKGPHPGRGRDGDAASDRLPELYSIHRAKVQSVRPFGLFVRLEGFVKHGLVHLSHVSDHEIVKRDDSDEMKIRGLASVAEEGDPVWVKIISLKQDESGNVKVGCSLKLVSQSSGKDLDPNNLKLEQQQPRSNRSDSQKVSLGAVYNVVCSRCGGHGHLRKECYSTGDKAYELLPDDDPEELGGERAFERLKDTANRSTTVREQAAVQLPTDVSRQTKESKLPDTVTTVEEALAVIAQLKEEKKERRKRKHKHDRHKRERKHSKMERRKREDDGGDRNRDGKRRKKGRD